MPKYKVIYLPTSKGWQDIEAADDNEAKRIAARRQGVRGIEGYDLIEFRPVDSYNNPNEPPTSPKT